jgi:hypothetical protein
MKGIYEYIVLLASMYDAVSISGYVMEWYNNWWLVRIRKEAIMA